MLAPLLAAREATLAQKPEKWDAASTHFEVMLVDAASRVRRIADAFRYES